MPTIDVIKEQEVTATPLFLFECNLVDGSFQRWSTHGVTADSNSYSAKITRHNLFELRASSDDGIDGLAKISVTLADADSFFSEIERNIGWKGAQVTVRFVFADTASNTAISETAVVFRGIANAPDEITESSLRLTFTNRLNLTRILLPEVRIQRRCPWAFPATLSQRQEAATGGSSGQYSKFFRCGYSADVTGGVGNLNAGQPFLSCDFTRTQCVQRGMFDHDSANHPTARFGGVEFVPASILVRGHGESGSHLSVPVENLARYNDFVPIVYGTAWYQPPIVFARNDGNLTRMEVLLGMGEMAGILKVVVNNIEIPLGQAGKNMTATGWYNVISLGTRSGAFNPDFSDKSGAPLGDPYGSMAFLSVVVPNNISQGTSLASIYVLARGAKLSRYNSDGTFLDVTLSNNPAWVILDALQRSGWKPGEMNLSSFAAAAAHCDQLVAAVDLNGNAVQVPRFQSNVVLRKRRSAADLIRSIRAASGLYLTYGVGGLLELRSESTLAVQQPVKPDSSNSTAVLNNGWPAYEFSDGSAAFSGILRRDNGESSVRLSSRSFANTPNRVSVEFQDEFNEYQQDSMSLVDVNDSLLSAQEISATSAALGIPNFSQAARVLRVQIEKAIQGNVFVEFETSFRAVGLKPGDLITLTYLKEGFARQPFRILSISPSQNFATTRIAAQIHNDAWYDDSSDPNFGGSGGRRQRGSGLGIPRPLVGTVLDTGGVEQFGVAEHDSVSTDGTASVTLTVAFVAPTKTIAPALGIPLLSLAPTINPTGGTLAGGAVYYYSVSAVDSNGAETPLSFSVTASIPAGPNTNTVSLTNLSFSGGTASFNVYRGATPLELLRIASNVAVAATYLDTGLATMLIGPPDENFDHANFYFRLELQPPTAVDIHSPTTIGNSTLGMLPNENTGMTVRITSGLGARQERSILGNTATTLTVASPWDIEPDATSSFTIAESGFRFGAVGQTSPIEFEVPNRSGNVVQISGRSANVHNQECAYSLSPLTRWQIGGSPGSSLDADVPPTPTFGLFPTGQGTVQLVGVAFLTLVNTRTIEAGTLTLDYYDELSGPTPFTLAAGINASATSLTLNIAGSGQPNDLIQIGSEVMSIQASSGGGTQYTVVRAAGGSAAAAHLAGASVYFLQRKVFIVPFVRDFFGSPASGSFTHSIFLPDVRIAVGELFVTNTHGNSGTVRISFTGTVDAGLRTLSGGQFSIQVEGNLAIQTSVAPPLLVENAHSVRDVYAVVSQAPSVLPLTMQLNRNGVAYGAPLTIAAGATVSNVLPGFGLPVLQSNDQITLDITGVGQSGGATPGRDLTLTIRL